MSSVTDNELVNAIPVQFNIMTWPDELGHTLLPAPEQLPTSWLDLDRVLLNTLRYESLWASAVAIYASKIATKGWYIQSRRPRLRSEFHDMLHRARIGTRTGWVPFVVGVALSYLHCRAAFIEIERTAPGPTSRAVNLHVLNPLKCLLTNSRETPVLYLSDDGKWHELRDYQVIVLSELNTFGDLSLSHGISAAHRSYKHIYKMASIEAYFLDKITGRRPQTLDLVSGISTEMLDDMRKAYEAEQRIAANSKVPFVKFRGSALSGLLTDKNIVHVRIPLSEIPDGFDRDLETRWAARNYANNTGIDMQDILELSGAAMGTGAQSTILHEKQKGRPPEMFATALAAEINRKVFPRDVTFAWYYRDLRDEQQVAANRKTRTETRKLQIESGELTVEQARIIAMQEGDIPPGIVQLPEGALDELPDDMKPFDESEYSEAMKRLYQERAVSDLSSPAEVFRETLDEALVLVDKYRG